MTELMVRHAEVRAQGDTAAREFTGIGVPYGQTIEWWPGEFECFDPGSVHLAEDVPPLVLWQHDRRQPIGVIAAGADTAEGFEIVGRLSATAEREYTLLREGVVTRLSIGFIPHAWTDVVEDGVTVRHYTNVTAREFSLVSFPAYPTAAITNVRNQGATMTQTATEPVAPETRTTEPADTRAAELAELRRAIDAIRAGSEPSPARDERSAGEYLRALAGNDPDTVRHYEALVQRAYTGGTTADTVMQPAWVGSLVEIFDASSGVLADVFSTGPLPATGMTLEYGRLASNTVTVTEQANEGDDLPTGKVAITTENAQVKTYGGAASLTRQEIERASVGVLNTTLEALASAAGARKKAVLRTAYNALVAAREGIAANAGVIVLGATLAAGTAGHWEEAIVNAAIRFSQQNLRLENLVVSASVFKKFLRLTVDGERVFAVSKGNHSGELSLIGLSGEFAGLPVRLDPDQAGDKAAFTNARALRSYDSALVHLSDENIINLSKAFSVYRYGAVADEVPAGVVPVKLTA